ncbi:Protein sds23 [Penicillium atrosanguineum]|uniref:Protein sds23 n=1 Tax=Penicillium atrosanguineum TaxID=1132637 RepID=UPI0023A0485C|nr:Protein sds23 [Penicillium atrosanguineum]KAJ5122606.1 Protein sds23 [Penicillium atrosanguineum]KAJ5310248.1 Protein sds23 [Penicillium atrosanguineum]
MSDTYLPRGGSETSLNSAADPGDGSGIASPRTSTDSRPSTSQHRPSHMPPANQPHRQSLSETLRGPPGSPRTRRQPSLNQAALQSLIDNPPPPKTVDSAFVGRDWREISIGELVSPEDLQFVELDTGIEEATTILIDSGTSVLLIRESPEHNSAVATFDYSDLNTYLLLAAGLTLPAEEHRASYDELAKKAREGTKIPLKDVKDLGMENEPLVTMPATANVLAAVETFGGGIHRVVVTKEADDNEVIGIFSQFRLVKFLWENGRSFPIIDELYPQALNALQLGSQSVISINGDKPLSEALQIMNSEGITSLVVVDNHMNVIGNISATDVKLLTRSSSLPLLQNTCTHFISVILSTRGLIEGKDSFPVFHVHPTSTLAHTVAKMVATRSHRLWVTDPLSPSSSGPPTPSHSTPHIPLATPNNAVSPPPSPLPQPTTSIQAPDYATPHLPAPPQPFSGNGLFSHPSGVTPLAPSIPASSLPGARLSGRLVGVVSLTDILNMHARATGLSPADPAESRRRRRSSSSSMNFRRSGEVGRELFSRGGM